MPRIDVMYAFIAEDTGPDDEGVAAMIAGGMVVPLVAADQARVDSLRRAAHQIADASGKTLRLVRFSVREELEIITGEVRP